MKKNMFIFFLLIVFFSVFSKHTIVLADTITYRISGNNRYETNAEVTRSRWVGNSDYAILTTGENYPDALSASTLAKKYNAPILLTGKEVLNENTAIELTGLGVKQVFIVGGIEVIYSAVDDKLNSMGIKVTRISGKDRYETSVEVAKYFGENKEVFIVSGEDFADALSIAPIAAKNNSPILLCAPNAMNDSLKNYLSIQKPDNIYVIGDKSIISDDVLSGLDNVVRIPGKDKYEINLQICSAFYSDLNFDSIFLATGEDYPDALSAAAIAANTDSPIILLNDLVADHVKNYLSNKLDKISRINVLGGKAVISDVLLKDIFGDLGNYARLVNVPDITQNVHLYNVNDPIINGDWIYQFEKTDNEATTGLYRLKKDGTGSEQLAKSNITLFRISGEWIYYMDDKSNLSKVKLDGTSGVSNLSMDELYNIDYNQVLQGEWIYSVKSFQLGDPQGRTGLYRRKIQETTSTQIAADIINGFKIYGEWIYYVDGKLNLNKIKIDGTSKTLIRNDISPTLIKISGDTIYYNGHLGIYKMDIDGTNNISLFTGRSDSVVVDGSYIYYSNYSSGKTCKMDINGNNKQVLTDQWSYNLRTEGQWIYYEEAYSKSTFRVGKDGTGLQKLN